MEHLAELREKKKNIIDYIKNKMSEIDKNEVKKRKKINDMLE